MSERASCPPSCGLYEAGCFAQYGKLGAHWRAVPDRGITWGEFLARVRALPAQTLWRHNVAGDLVGPGSWDPEYVEARDDRIDTERLEQLVAANRGRCGFTYTHCFADTDILTWAEDGGFITSEAYWRKPLGWDRRAEKLGTRLKVFCASFADVFEDRDDLTDVRDRLGDLVLRTPHLDWLLLTKRPENIEHLAPRCWSRLDFPANVWLGTTMGVRASRTRLTALLRGPRATVKFVSAEPLLDDVVDALTAPMCPECFSFEANKWGHCDNCDATMLTGLALNRQYGGIDWLIVGGESGSRARPFNIRWARDLVRACRLYGAAPFVKQLGSHVRWDGISMPGQHWPTSMLSEQDAWPALDQDAPFRVRLKDGHGGDPSEWPDDLKVREYPTRGLA